MKAFRSVLTRHWPVFVLALVELVLILTNIPFDGRWFLGWDSTTPEINVSLNFWRFFTAIWQEYRGLGTVDGMAHAANIVHWVYSAVLSVFVPNNLVRPLLNNLTHFFGGWGVFVLVRIILHESALTKKHPISKRTIQLISLAAALFAMLNLFTIQMYYLPLELFSFHFMILPWSLWAVTKYMNDPTYKHLFLLCCIQIAGLSQAHVPTIFVSYMLIIGCWLLGWVVSTDWWNAIKSACVAVLIILIVNSLWFAPYSYSIITKSAEISNSKQNRIGTSSVFYRNSAWGTARSIFTFGGFTLDYTDWNEESNSIQLLMDDWKTYWQSSIYTAAVVPLSIVLIVGFLYLLYQWLQTRSKLYFSITLAWFFTLTMLGTEVTGIKYISAFLREHVPLFAQIFRFTFTKFSLGYVVLSSILFAIGLYLITVWISQLLVHRKISTTESKIVTRVFSSVIVVLLIVSWPVFGDMYYSKLFVSVPDSYFSFAQNYQQTTPNGRYATLPIHSMWGWTTNTTEWGYRGSGFLWQLVEQPMVDRAFDPWSKHNETAYLQLSQSLYTQDTEKFAATAQKYAISDFLYDKSVFHPGNYPQVLFKEEIPQFMSELATVRTSYSDESLEVFSLPFPDDRSTGLFAPARYTEISDTYATTYTRNDRAYQDHGSYIIREHGVEYPFSALQSDELTKLPKNIVISDDEVIFTLDRAGVSGLSIPSLSEMTSQLPAVITNQQLSSATQSAVLIDTQLPTINGVTESNTISIPVPTEDEYFITVNDKVSSITDSNRSVVATLKTTVDNKVSIFSTTPNSSVEVEPYVGTENCDFLRDRFYAQVPDSIQCQSIEINSESVDVDESTELLAVIFDYRSEGGGTPEVCIAAKNAPRTCLNDAINSIVYDSTDWNTTSVVIPVSSQDDYVMYFMSEYSDADRHVLEYDQITLQTYALLGEDTISLQPMLNSIDAKMKTALATSTDLSLSFPMENFAVYPNWELSKVDSLNCSQNTIGRVDKNISSSGVTLESQDRGILCDEILLPTLLPETEYLYQIEGETDSGAGAKVVLTNPFTKNFDIETIAPQSMYQMFIPVTLGRNKYKNTYDLFTLNFTLESFGSEKNQTTISKQVLYPLPLRWLQSFSQDSQKYSKENSLVLEGYTKKASFWYSATVDQSGLLSLGQAFDSGWLAFPGWRIWDTHEHVEYNGWANGWIIPGQPAATGTERDVRADSSQKLKITILFWPQLLSFAGYGVLVLTLAWLGWAAWSEKTTQADEDQSTHRIDKSQRIKDKTKQRLAGK